MQASILKYLPGQKLPAQSLQAQLIWDDFTNLSVLTSGAYAGSVFYQGEYLVMGFDRYATSASTPFEEIEFGVQGDQSSGGIAAVAL